MDIHKPTRNHQHQQENPSIHGEPALEKIHHSMGKTPSIPGLLAVRVYLYTTERGCISYRYEHFGTCF